jgi:CRISPR-associated endonuclease Cas1
MAASKTVPQPPQYHNSLIPRHGVLTLFGYGIQVRVDRGHLFIEDGIATERRQMKFPRVGHGLKRLVIIGSDGVVSLAALRFLSDVGASFVMLERDGTVLLATGPVRSSDARLRRAQAMAIHSGAALKIARELISRKLAGQERVARYRLLTTQTADAISRSRAELARADSFERIRIIESQAAAAYWAAWRMLPINFPKRDEQRVPAHWRTFGTRVSPLTGSPRRAVNPSGAILNYLYAVLESECRLAAAALGLDPGLGVLHVDLPARDSLACDLMEAVRADIDDFFLRWATRETLKREWFLEQKDGNARLMAVLAVRLSETAPMWRHAVAPIAEWVARAFWSNSAKPARQLGPPTRLTQRRRREAKGGASFPPTKHSPRWQKPCPGCGKDIRSDVTHCSQCAIEGATQRLAEAARLGRVVARTPEVRAKQAATQRQQARARSSWKEIRQPAWLTAEVYSKRIQPLLAGMSSSSIASRIGVSRWYAGRIRRGYRPHPMHWQGLAGLVGLTQVRVLNQRS